MFRAERAQRSPTESRAPPPERSQGPNPLAKVGRFAPEPSLRRPRPRPAQRAEWPPLRGPELAPVAPEGPRRR
eukprot:8238869-Alexandrium_andersonii.AAC.1